MIAYPGFLFLLLFTAIQYFRGWQHHQHVQIRIMQTFLASWLGCLLFRPFVDLPPMTAAIVFVAIVVIGTHYVVPGISKLSLKKSYSVQRGSNV